MIPKPGQDHDVDLGVPEEPEQVLPEQRVPPWVGSKKCVPKWRSVSSSVTAPAITGSARISRIA